MTARVLFLAIFVAGLGLAVYSMLHGVERSRASHRARASWKPTRKRPSATFNTPAASTLAIVLGATGYLLVTRSGASPRLILILPLAIALVATAGMIVLMSKWALPYSGLESEAELIQGQLARVTSPISPSQNGEITFDTDGVTHTVAAQSIHGSEIPRDAEVVIDTIEDGVAKVELWSAVEARL